MINYYDILGVPSDALPEEIKAAYTFQIRALHPDRYNPATQPELYVRAEQLTRRLNEARTVLLDPAQRRAYDAVLHGQTEAPSSPWPAPRLTPLTPSQARWALLGLMAAVFVVSLTPGFGRIASARPAPATASLAVTTPAATPLPCPTSSPRVTVDQVTIEPDLSAPGFGPPSRLYLVSGTITNPTPAAISLADMGFYLGAGDPAHAPAWTSAVDQMELNGDPNQLSAGATISYHEKYRVTLPDGQSGPFPASVTATLSYPLTDTTKTQPHWLWIDNVACNDDPSRL